MGGRRFFRHMEHSLSNSLRITDRRPGWDCVLPAVPDDEFPELDQLFREYVKG
jgi:hypothetical protein